MFVGEEKPDSGELRVGPTVELGMSIRIAMPGIPRRRSFKRSAAGHDVLEMGGRKLHSRGYVSKFNFKGA